MRLEDGVAPLAEQRPDSAERTTIVASDGNIRRPARREATPYNAAPAAPSTSPATHNGTSAYARQMRLLRATAAVSFNLAACESPWGAGGTRAAVSTGKARAMSDGTRHAA